MPFKRKISSFKHKRMLPQLVAVLLGITLLALFTACNASDGSIIITEDINGAGCKMEFKSWGSVDKCDIHLKEGDTVRVDTLYISGEISLSIKGTGGTEPYTGNDLRSGMFTVTVSEEDDYSIELRGKNASGSISVQKI